MTTPNFKSGVVAVVGKANAGKSTLINVLVGEKVSIVSPKPQTTRERILGILNEKNYQMVFADTPGVYRHTTKLSTFMQNQIESTVKGSDVVLFVIDGHLEIDEVATSTIKKYQQTGIPLVVVLTKIDIAVKESLPLKYAFLKENGITAPIVPVSARKKTNLNSLKETLVELLPHYEKLYSEDVLSDKSQKFMVAEILREKILLKYDKEIPHGIAVTVNEFKKRQTGNLYDVNLDIVCEKPNHKAILIGKQGSALKEAAAFARSDMEKFLGAKVFLTVYVKVKENWRDNARLIKEYGYLD